jgi:lipid II:glycine glycyltransferase (peptidoglycan interpeptide bridge formation enzyme)
MREAKARGLKYYDLGGIDDARWPTLTNFKRQFKGQEFAYIGNLDVPIRPLLYRSYNLFRSFKHP